MISSLTLLLSLQYVHALNVEEIVQAGHKRTKSVGESAASAEKVAAPAADSGAKQALENEFECTICRVSNRTVVALACYQSKGLCTCVLLQTLDML
jgi:hypothetical protein